VVAKFGKSWLVAGERREKQKEAREEEEGRRKN
jgi:hypothetical protein